MLIFRCLTLDQAVKSVSDGGSVLVFLFALMLFSALLDRAGFFEWCALHAAQAARGSSRRLYTNVFIVGAVITAFLSLDTTAIILTPIVVSFVHRLKLNELPFVMACAFVSNTGSLLLPVSNLTNLLFQHAFNISFLAFFTHMLLPQLVAVSLNYLLFMVIFRQSLRESYDCDLPEPASVVENAPFFKLSWLVLALVVVGYFVGSLLDIAPYIVALTGCMLLLVPAVLLKRVTLKELKGEISWELFPFVIGLFIEIRALENLGLIQIMAQTLTKFNHNPLEELLATTFSTALGSNIVNNVPMALLSLSVLRQLHDAAKVTQFAALIGCDIGPNLTVAGSLATMLVLTSARKRGIEITAWQFFKTGLVVTPLVLLFSTLTLWLSLYLSGGIGR